MEEKLFGALLSGVRFGLVRLTSQLVIVDKNSMADVIFPFPKRGACAEAILKRSEDRLNGLGNACGSACAVVVSQGRLSRPAVAFRERDGGILLFLHPLLASVCFDDSDSRFKRLVSLYASGIYGIIEEMDSRGGFVHSKVAALPGKSLSDYSQKDYRSLKNAVSCAVEKISQLVLRKKLTVIVDKMYSDSVRGVIFSRLDYALGELITVRELYGEETDAVIEIGVTEDCLAVTLRDKITKSDAAEYYIRIFGEILKILEIGSYARMTENGDLTLRTFIPFAEVKTLLCDDTLMEWETFSYMEYCLVYLSIGKADLGE